MTEGASSRRPRRQGSGWRLCRPKLKQLAGNRLSRLLSDRREERKPGVETILVTNQGQPSSVGGLGGSFSRIHNKAAIVHKIEEVENDCLASR